MTAGEGSGSVTQAWSTDVPGLSVMVGMNRPAIGFIGMSTLITIFGFDFGNSVFTLGARVSLSSCMSTNWLSDSSLSCLASSGLTRTSGFVVTSVIFPGTRTDIFSYEFQISSLKTANVLGQVNRLIWSIGTGFCDSDYSLWSRLHFTSCQKTSWLSTSALKCIVTSGSCRSFGISVTVSNMVASMSEMVSFDSPFYYAPRKYNTLPFGPTTVSVISAPFSNTVGSFNARVSETSCASTIWISKTSLTLKVFFFSGFTSGSNCERSFQL